MFDGLTSEEISTVFNILDKPVTINKDEELYKNGMLGIVISGSAIIKRRNDIGAEITIRTITKDELFGSASVFGSWKNGMSSIIAKTACEVIYIKEEKFCEILKQYSQMSLNYITYLSDRIRFLNRKLDAFTTKSTEERLYEYLLSQADTDGNINLGFGMAELARRLQVGRTSIYRDIESLENKELISRNGHNFKIYK